MIDYVEKSGVVIMPVRVGKTVYQKPFYFVYEEDANQELMFLKFIDGSPPYRYGDVYGFFGLTLLENYQPGDPIALTANFIFLSQTDIAFIMLE